MNDIHDILKEISDTMNLLSPPALVVFIVVCASAVSLGLCIGTALFR